MATVAEPIRVHEESRPVPLPAEQRFVLHNADWQTYEKFLDAVGERRIRLTYDRGVLEIMTVSGLHEWWKSRLGYVIRLLGCVLQIAIQSYGSTTLKRQDRERGLEPDECYYVRNAARMASPRDLRLIDDPPPDLGVNISRSWLDRTSVYAALGVAEVWSFDGQTLRIYHLRLDGTYQAATKSLNFPMLPLPEFARFLQQTAHLNDSLLLDPLREWVGKHIVSPPPGATPSA